jgi:hypothetical protein
MCSRRAPFQTSGDFMPTPVLVAVSRFISPKRDSDNGARCLAENDSGDCIDGQKDEALRQLTPHGPPAVGVRHAAFSPASRRNANACIFADSQSAHNFGVTLDYPSVYELLGEQADISIL